MSKNFYEILWVSKDASDAEIKKAYRKKAMEYHPDRNKGDKTSEEKFKEINNAYETLSDASKRKQYDMFWTASWSNPFWWWYSNSSSWFEDIFSNFARSQSSSNYSNSSSNFNFEDIFAWMWSEQRTSNRHSKQEKSEPESLDFNKIYEIPVFDLILWCKIEVTGVYWQKAKLKIPFWTKPSTKFRVKDFWKKEWTRIWNLIVEVQAKMPKEISDVDKHMLERIRENIGY